MPTLALLVVGVHDSIDDGLVGGEGAGGTQQRVDESGLAVVDVRDERDIAIVLRGGHWALCSAGAVVWGKSGSEDRGGSCSI
jgi:hypothetical protein